MKKVSYFIGLMVVVSAAIISFWVWQKYFKNTKEAMIVRQVTLGDLQEKINVRGEVVAEKEFNLEFPFSGIVQHIAVTEGQAVAAGTYLMKLDTTDLEIEKKKLEANLAESQANLDKLLAGTRIEEVNVAEAKVTSAHIAVADAQSNLVSNIKDAYTKSDDAIRNTVDQFFTNPRTANDKVVFSANDQSTILDIERTRWVIENMLTAWKTSLDELTSTSDLKLFVETANNNLVDVKNFLDITALAVNGATVSANVTQTMIDTWRAGLSTARTNINTAITNLSTADEKLNSALAAVDLATKELALTKAATRSEDVNIAEANVLAAQSQVDTINEKIKKATLYAPAAAIVKKVSLEEREVFNVGTPAIILQTKGYKVQADVSELEIGKVRELDGNDISIQFDAFPDQKFKGRVVSIEPQQIVKDEDKYYRVNMYLDNVNVQLRPGMSADIVIMLTHKFNVLKIPEIAVVSRDGKKFVKVLENGKLKEFEVEVGISDGESIEVTKGLTEGQSVVISAD